MSIFACFRLMTLCESRGDGVVAKGMPNVHVCMRVCLYVLDYVCCGGGRRICEQRTGALPTRETLTHCR